MVYNQRVNSWSNSFMLNQCEKGWIKWRLDVHFLVFSNITSGLYVF